MKSALFALLFLPFWAFAQTPKGVVPVAQNTAANASATRAVVIGISDYQDKDIPDLRFADKDAEAFANFLRSEAGGSLDNDHLQVLLNQNATAGRIAEALDALLEQTREGEQVIIYFSGHGDVERKTVSQPGFLLCWDAPNRVYMGGGTYSLAYLQEIVTTLSTQNKAKVVMVTDACHAGKLAGSQIGGAQLTAANLAKQFANEIKILSCQPGELSLEGEQWGGGRGIFSYHLVEGLIGLADKNSDGFVTLGELDRYLEDKVTAEAAPQSQVPMLLGNKTEKLAAVKDKILQEIKKKKSGETPVFLATEGRGLEEEVLAKVDSSISALYLAFKRAVHEKRFFTPENDCAEVFYLPLSQNEALAPLHGMMKRNYAAALQDDAQQVMNIWLKADVQQLSCIGKSIPIQPIPRQLARAKDLLGENHYMYRSLYARQLLFEGVLMMQQQYKDPAAGDKSIHLFKQTIELEPQSALAWHQMSLVYADNLDSPDSAFYCAEQALRMAPNWVLPYINLGHRYVSSQRKDLVLQALAKASDIDSLHPYVTALRLDLLVQKGDRNSYELAKTLYTEYRNNGGTIYPCWLNDYGVLLTHLGDYSAAEKVLFEGIAMDSLAAPLWSNLATVYEQSNRLVEAEKYYVKSLWLNPNEARAYGNLTRLYGTLGRDEEGEVLIKKAIELDSTFITFWTLLGDIYMRQRRYEEAEPLWKKVIGMDSSMVKAWNELGFLYIQTKKYELAEPIFNHILELNPNHIQSWNNLGNIYRETNQFEASERMYRQAFSIHPDFMPTYRNFAKLKSKTGDFPSAFSNLERAIQLGYSDYKGMQTDPGFAPLRTQAEWKPLMKKYFPDQATD